MPKIEYKTCGKCGETKIVAEFYAEKANRDGYSNWCKSCNREQKRIYHKKLVARHHIKSPPKKNKQCSLCGIEKPLSEFYKSIGHLDGYRPLCNECNKILNAKYRKKIADREFGDIERNGKKRCSLCHKILPSKMFNYSRANYDGLSSFCRRCSIEYKQQYYNQHRDEEYLRSCEYKRQHPERIKAYRICSEAIRKGIIVRPDKCSKCGKKGNIIAYYNNYINPLKDIDWLCISCHRQLHADLKRKRLK
jgi:hypothetical protein